VRAKWLDDALPDAFPALAGGQLLRSVQKAAQKQAQVAQEFLDTNGFRVAAGQPQRSV
jgi:hypothetical protein